MVMLFHVVSRSTSSRNRKHPEFGQCCGLRKLEIHPAVDPVQPDQQHLGPATFVPRSGHPASFLGGQVKATVLEETLFSFTFSNTR